MLDTKTLLNRHRDAPIIIASLVAENELFRDLKQRGFTHVYPLSYLHFLNPDIFKAPYLDGLFESCFDPALQNRIGIASGIWADDESKQIYKKILEYRRTKSMDIYPRLRANHPQYFPPGIITFTDDDIVLDAGAYVGDTLRSFAELNPGARNTYYGFEPDPQNYAAFQREGKRYAGKLVAVNGGIAAEEGNLGFISNAQMDSAFTRDAADLMIRVHTIDKFFAHRSAPTFIKMDIEGMELQALAGGEQIIRRTKPKLAICVYHRPEHLWDIPLMVRDWNPDYRFYLCHYSTNMSETVMYAV